jgi:DNA replication protein DnaC
MNLIELQHALRQLRLGGIATVLETRLHQAQAEAMAPIDLISCLVADELTRRGDRLLERRRKQAAFRDPQKTLDHFDFTFNPKMNRSLVFDLATCARDCASHRHPVRSSASPASIARQRSRCAEERWDEAGRPRRYPDLDREEHPGGG